MLNSEERKIYAVFCGDRHHPLGGAKDFVGLFASAEVAIGAAGSSAGARYKSGTDAWAQVFNLETFKFVFRVELNHE